MLLLLLLLQGALLVFLRLAQRVLLLHLDLLDLLLRLHLLLCAQGLLLLHLLELLGLGLGGALLHLLLRAQSLLLMLLLLLLLLQLELLLSLGLCGALLKFLLLAQRVALLDLWQLRRGLRLLRLLLLEALHLLRLKLLLRLDGALLQLKCKRSANPSFISPLKLRTSGLRNQRTRRGGHGSTADGTVPGASGGVSCLWPEGAGMGRGQRGASGNAAKLVRTCAALAGAARRRQP
nr:hypothetical protein [Variovorax sp. PBL-H6]